MKTVFESLVLQKYRNYNKKWYGILGHRGVDLAYKYEPLPSPITGVVLNVIYDPKNRRETGQCILVTDAWGSVHVFAHMKQIDVVAGQSVRRGERLGVTGNTGTITSGPHLHYEVITKKAHRLSDAVMVRMFDVAKGKNTDPIPYLKDLYKAYGVPYP